MSDDVVRHYTEAVDEDARLQQGMGRFEYERTTELIGRYLGPPPQVVVDAGGGTGAYALWLAAAGHEVHLVDLVPRHVDQVQAKAERAALRLGSARVGDARSLPFPDGFADLVLLLGPLYHLTEHADRVQAVREAGRVAKRQGRVLCGAISRYASVVAGFRDARFRSPEFEPMVDRDLRDGQHRNPVPGSPHLGTAFLHRPRDVRAEIEQAGLLCEGVLAVETAAALVGQLEAWRSQEPRFYELTHKYARAIEGEESLLGASLHLLGVARHA
jgi:SAM-dependent methyltransferase